MQGKVINLCFILDAHSIVLFAPAKELRELTFLSQAMFVIFSQKVK